MKSRLSILLVICAATHLPTPCSRAAGLCWPGAGGSVIDLSTEQTEPHSRPSSTLRVGYGGQRVKVVLDWQRHGWGDDQVLTSDYQNGVQTRYPEVLRTDFLLSGGLRSMSSADCTCAPMVWVFRGAWSSRVLSSRRDECRKRRGTVGRRDRSRSECRVSAQVAFPLRTGDRSLWRSARALWRALNAGRLSVSK